jgi:hypothetical protein
MNLNENFFLNQNDYFVSHVCKKTKLVLHFYVKSVSCDELKDIERDSLDSIEWGMGSFHFSIYLITTLIYLGLSSRQRNDGSDPSALIQNLLER